MKINRNALDIVLARNCVSISSLKSSGISSSEIARVSRGDNLTTKSVGKIAKALGVDVTEIIAKED